jgi:hypothetical protein
MRDLRSAPSDRQASAQMAFVEIVPSAPQEAEADRAGRAYATGKPAQCVKMTETIAPSAEHPVKALERCVTFDPSLVFGTEVGQGSLEIPYGELGLMSCTRGPRRLEIEVGGAAIALAASEMARDDGRGNAARERRSSEVLAESAMHSYARTRIERCIRDVTRQGMSEVDRLTAPVAKPAGAESYGRLVVASIGQLQHVAQGEWSTRDGKPVDDRVLFGRQFADTVAE